MFKFDQFFKCDEDCAVFVSLDKLSDRRANNKPSRKVRLMQHQVMPYKIGDRVRAFDNNGGSVTGTVKWIGKHHEYNFAGIQTVSTMYL